MNKTMSMLFETSIKKWRHPVKQDKFSDRFQEWVKIINPDYVYQEIQRQIAMSNENIANRQEELETALKNLDTAISEREYWLHCRYIYENSVMCSD